MTILILGLAIILFLGALVLVVDAIYTRRYVDRLLDQFSTGYVHMADGCEDDSCPCIQRHESQKQVW